MNETAEKGVQIELFLANILRSDAQHSRNDIERIENMKKSLKRLLKILKIFFEGIRSFGQRKHKTARNDWIMRFPNVWHCLEPLRVW